VKLEGRVALITGAGSGIGRAVAQLFAREGARVVANDLHATAAKETVESLGDLPEAARAIQADVADSGQVKAMFAEIEREMGTLDVLVNNAGIAGTSAAERERLLQKSDARIMEMVRGQGVTTHWDITQNMTDEAWLRMIGVHLNGTFFCTREALRLMSRRNRGAIVNMSSVAGLMGSRTCRTTARPRRASWASRERWRARSDRATSA
jgi:3-oxoacyl-[acyl-carrier protein] reductase